MKAGTRIRLGAITLIAILAGAISARPQDESTPAVPLVSPGEASPLTPTSSYREGLIHLDVSIADRSGKPIAALDLSDLTLFDNGKPAKVLTLRPGYPADPNARLSEVALIIDDLDSSGPVMAQARSELINYLRRNNGVLPQLTAVYRLTDAGLYASPRLSMDGNELARDVARNSFPLPVWHGVGPALRLLECGEFDGCMRNWSKALHSIYALAVKWSQEPGRKALIWIGPGWSVNGYISSRLDPFPLLVELLSRIREARMVIYQASLTVRPDHDFDYRVFAQGVRSASELKEHMQYFALPVLALESGGMVFDQGFSVAGVTEQSLRDARSFYILSFDPPHAEQPDEYHELRIEMAKPGFTARTNSGYYDQPVFYDQSRVPARRVTVQQLESVLEGDDKQHDGELAVQLGSMELTECLSSTKLASWLRQIRGKQSREALIVLADASVYLTPPDDEVDAKPKPDCKSQVQMLKRTVQYLNQMAPQLPDFYAIRTLAEYDERVREGDPWKTAAADQSLHEWVTEKSTMLYRRGREEQIIHK